MDEEVTSSIESKADDELDAGIVVGMGMSLGIVGVNVSAN